MTNRLLIPLVAPILAVLGCAVQDTKDGADAPADAPLVGGVPAGSATGTGSSSGSPAAEPSVSDTPVPPAGTGSSEPPGGSADDGDADDTSTGEPVDDDAAPIATAPTGMAPVDEVTSPVGQPGDTAGDDAGAPSEEPPLEDDDGPAEEPDEGEQIEPPSTLDAGAAEGGSPGEEPVSDEIIIPEKFVGNITTGNGVDTEGLSFAEHWNQITPENAGKWGSVQADAGGNFNWSTLDAIYDYAEANGIVFKQHTFVWGNQQPRGNIGEAQVREWMRAFCERYPRTAMIDVVNEPPPHTTPNYANSIGGGTNGNWQWITNSFLWAREACPKAILLLNDFNNIEWPNDHQHFVNIVKTTLAAGAPIDALGAQAHDLDNPSVSFDRVRGFLQALHDETGLPVYITEYDISTTDDNAQLAAYQQHIPHFLGLDFVPGITIWGWIYGRTWSSAPNSGLIRDGRPRPAMTWLMTELGRPVP